MRVPDPLTCLLRNLYAGTEATVRTLHETIDWFKIGKGELQCRIQSLCPFNFYAEDTVWNAGLDESQAGVKIARRKMNNLEYADDTTLMVESGEELKSPLWGWKEESRKAGLKLNIQKTKIVASCPITSWQIDGEKMGRVRDYFLGSKITVDRDYSREIKRPMLLGKKLWQN